MCPPTLKKNILLTSYVEIYIQNVHYLVVSVPLLWSEWGQIKMSIFLRERFG